MNNYLTSPNIWIENFLMIFSLFLITWKNFLLMSILCFASSLSKRYSSSFWSKFSRKHSRLNLWHGCVIVPLILNSDKSYAEYETAFTLITLFFVSYITSVKHLLLGVLFYFLMFGSCFTLGYNLYMYAALLSKVFVCFVIFLACFVRSDNSFSFGEAFTVAQLTKHFFILIVTSQAYFSFNVVSFTFLVGSATGVLALLSVSGLAMVKTLQEYKAEYFYFVFCMITFVLLLVKGFTMILKFVLEFLLQRYPIRVALILFWLFLVVGCCFYISQRFSNKKASTVERKNFHVFIILVYFSGLLFDVPLLFLCSTLVLCLFIVASIICAYEIKPFGSVLRRFMTVFTDKQDSGKFILTPIYLVFGLSFPIWFCFVENPLLVGGFYHAIPFKFLSGIMSVGIGDATASLFGYKYGRTKIPGTNKSIEGTVASIIMQILVTFALQWTGVVELNVCYALLTISVVSFVEASTTEIDNLILPLLMYALLD